MSDCYSTAAHRACTLISMKENAVRAQIDAVIVSCSCYAPNPSMAAMLVHRFGLRADVLTFNLSGMGCSTSVVCVDMAKRLFKVWRDSCVQFPWKFP